MNTFKKHKLLLSLSFQDIAVIMGFKKALLLSEFQRDSFLYYGKRIYIILDVQDDLFKFYGDIDIKPEKFEIEFKNMGG